MPFFLEALAGVKPRRLRGCLLCVSVLWGGLANACVQPPFWREERAGGPASATGEIFPVESLMMLFFTSVRPTLILSPPLKRDPSCLNL